MSSRSHIWFSILSAAVLTLSGIGAAGGNELANGDFETGDLSFWTLTSGGGWEVAYFAHPNKQGDFYASTCNEIWPGEGGCKNSNGEADTGVLQSHLFQVTDRYLAFRIAGYSGQECQHKANLLHLRHGETHQLLRTTDVPCQNPFKPDFWDVGDYMGEEVYIQAEDGDSASGWAWIAVDDFHFLSALSDAGANHGELHIDSQAGQILFTASIDRAEHIYAMDADGGNARQLNIAPWKTFHPALSPDGRWIAFVSNRWSANGEVYIGSEGSEPQQLTFDPGYDHNPAWAPNGDWVAFVSDRQGESGIYVVNVDSGEQQHLTGQFTASDPSWSPDSRHLAFAANGEIYAVEVESHRIRQLTENMLWEGYPAWAPDGRRIAFAADGELHVMDVETKETHPLTYGFAFASQPAWTADGNYLAFVSDRDGDREIFALEIKTGAVQQLTDNDWDDFDPIWSPQPFVPQTEIADNGRSTPFVNHLKPGYPNPFNAATTIPFHLAQSASTELAVFDALGRKVKTLYRGVQKAGEYRALWDGTDDRGSFTSSGTYFLRLRAGNWSQTRKIALIR